MWIASKQNIEPGWMMWEEMRAASKINQYKKLGRIYGKEPSEDGFLGGGPGRSCSMWWGWVLCGEYFDLKPSFISEFMISKDLVSLKDLLNGIKLCICRWYKYAQSWIPKQCSWGDQVTNCSFKWCCHRGTVLFSLCYLNTEWVVS